MKGAGFSTVLFAELKHNAKRPLYWIWFVLLFLNAQMLSTGNWIIRSVDTSVGTQKSWVNSEFQIAFAFSLMTVIMMGLFIGIATGAPIIRDAQQKINELIGSTPLTSKAYVWGKFLAHFLSSVAVICLFVMTLAFLNEVSVNPAFADIHGPFRLGNYLGPTLVFLLPFTTFIAGFAFALGQFTRKIWAVYLFPIVVLLFSFNFLFDWFPDTMSPTTSFLLQFMDPTGFRWLKQTWLIADRGVAFYNANPIGYGFTFLISRVFWMLLGLALVSLSAKHFSDNYARIPDKPDGKRRKPAAPPVADAITGAEPLSQLNMTNRLNGFIRQTASVAWFEFREMMSHPWLFVFIALIAIFMVSADQGGRGDLHVQMIYTSGTLAVQGLTNLSILGCFLLLFTNAESLHREVSCGLDGLFRSTPVSTGAVLIGKGLANLTVGFATIIASFFTVLFFVISQGQAPLEMAPFFQIWGALLIPTYIFWTALVMAAYSLTGSRMGAYGLCVGVMFLTGWLLMNGHMTWLTNWFLGGSMIWSDFGPFQLDYKAFVLNRLFYLSLAGVLMAYAVYRFPRRSLDKNRGSNISRLGLGLRIGAWIAAPVIIGGILWGAVQDGFQGPAAEKRDKDYWRHNMATWREAPLPHMVFIDMEIQFFPERRAYELSGWYDCQNLEDKPLSQIPFTGLGYWTNLKWTLDGEPFEPENRSGMYVFTPEEPLGVGETMRVGFSYEGVMLPGISRNGGPLPLNPPTMGEFILPEGIVLTGRNPYFVPVLGFQNSVGVDEENRHQPKIYGPNFHEGINDSVLDRSKLDIHIKLTVPEGWTANSIGALRDDKTENGLRTMVWESDHPVRLFNVIAGKWDVKRGEGTAVFYHPKHTYNLDSITEGLDTARHYYSEWFGQYPWQDLRLSEFPGFAFYARGNPTNIFFTETLGFLTLDRTVNVRDVFGSNAFGVTAHEAAHQWWGHMLSPADGPGTILLAEGMANYATMLLLSQVRGESERIAFNRQRERFYGENRSVSSERPLIESEFFRPADVTVVYDKGGWVFYMLHQLLGEEQMFAGLKAFIEAWGDGRDKPTMQDFEAFMRPYAGDQAAYDRFVQQWFHEVVMPEYLFMQEPEVLGVNGDYTIRTRVANVGTGSMPVEVAATKGRRFSENGDYQDARVSVDLGPGEEKQIVIKCNFKPERLVIDPDVKVLQIQRNGGVYRLK